MTQSSKNYVVISPVRDEGVYLRFTIESMLAQTIRPVEWIIVNDGSTDNTAAIIDEYASQHPWIRAVHRDNRGFRKAGGGVVEAFNDGYRALSTDNWEFIVKMDGDLTFQPDYFEKCLNNFQRDPRLGIGGWEAIGGFWPAPGWDTMDEVKANMLSWGTRSFPSLHLQHHRYTGTAEGIWAGMVKNGRANYVCGYHPLFMLVKCFLRLPRRPYFIGSVGLLYGFLSGYLKQIPQVDDVQTIGFLRRQQLGRLWGRETIWR